MLNRIVSGFKNLNEKRLSNKFFAANRAVKDKIQEYSTDKYRLVITPFETGKGCWSYTQGEVFSKETGDLIAKVKRNYSQFPFEWVESHPNGHDYLICGEDYQGQTVIELDTGKRSDYLPKEAKQGSGFCWSSYKFHPETQILIVDGCYWACPYEYRFYDFSDPMNGWPSIEMEDDYADSDSRWPEIDSDGLIRCYQTENDDEDEDEDDEPGPVASIKTFKREGLKLILQNEWVSDSEKIKRIERKEANEKHEQWLKTFKDSDPLYLEYVELVKDKKLSPEDSSGRGITYDGWCPSFKLTETRWCRRIVSKGKYTVDLEWAVDTGPIKLNIYKDKKKFDTKWFGHSVDGMKEAFVHTKELV